jgi:hypothetical protein
VAAGPVKKKETKSYVVALGNPVYSAAFPGNGVGGVGFTPPDFAEFMTVQINDQAGQALGRKTSGTICQDVTGDGTCDGSRSFCGQIATPFAIQPGFDVTVFVDGANTCGSDPSIGSTGTVTATFIIPQPRVLKEVGKRKLTWNAQSFCGQLCPYNDPSVTVLGTGPCDKDPGASGVAPPGSWDDIPVKVPGKVSGLVPFFMLVHAVPSVDFDVYVCRVEGDQYELAGGSANSGCTPVTEESTCAEDVRIPVKAGQRYIIRAYNWFDPTGAMDGQLSWQAAKA